MPTETTVRARLPPPDTPEEGNYRAFSEALSASERGRAFLAEYARRNRNADTELLLAAIERLQSLATVTATPLTAEPIKRELLALLEDIRAAQRELEDSIASMRAAKFAELITQVERRIANIVTSPRPEPLSRVEPPMPTRDLPNEPTGVSERTHLAVVPLPEQPELPIPSRSVAQLPTIALVRGETIMAEIAFVEPPPAPRASGAIEMLKADTANADAVEAVPAEAPAPSPANPFASIMALSEEERLALFT
jgi:hypothetical protein